MIQTSLADALLYEVEGSQITAEDSSPIAAQISAWEIPVSAANRQWTARIKNGNTTVDCSIKSLKFYKGACSGNFAPGSVYVPYVEAELLECDADLDGVELLFQIGLLIDEEYDYINIGYFTPVDPKVQTGAVSFTAVGRLGKQGNDEFTSLLSYPASIDDLIDELETAMGVTITLNGLVAEGTLEAIPTGTIRDVLGTVAGLLGGFVSEDNAGNIVISRYGCGAVVSIAPDRSLDLPSFWESEYTVSGIKVTVPAQVNDEEGTQTDSVTYTVGTPAIEITNPCMTRALFDAMYAVIQNYTFTPAAVDISLGDPRLEPWDSVAVTDLDGNTHIVPCFELIHEYHGGLSTKVSAEVAGTESQSLQVKGPIGKAIQQVENKGAKRYNILNRSIGELQSIIGEYDPELGTLQTQITQNAEAIELVAEDLDDNYYNKTEIDLTAEGLDTKISVKRRVFTSTPTPPYDKGDLWVQGSSGDIKVCDTAKASGASYAASDWVQASKYTDDTVANAEAAERTTLIRDKSGGTLTCYVGNSVGVYTNASGSVDIVSLTWSGDTPTITDTLASFSPSGVLYADDLSFAFGSDNAYIRFDATTGAVTIGGNVSFENEKTLSELIEQLNDETLTLSLETSSTINKFTAKLTRAGEDVTDEYPETDFEWYFRTAEGDEFIDYADSNYSLEIAKALTSYGRTVVCKRPKRAELYLATYDNYDLTDESGNNLIAYTEV